ncbi:hypothetical protein EV424DRAFT_529324 [Suillus variegatus]|nr:hypothetical protein EV424DRAFT_529324 [Suillus variegatus]
MLSTVHVMIRIKKEIQRLKAKSYPISFGMACDNITIKSTMHFLQVPGHATPYTNSDVIPLPPSRRTWSKKVFVFFWFATAINIAEWSGASASLALGLTVQQAIIVNLTSTIM